MSFTSWLQRIFSPPSTSGGDADLKALCTIDITDLQKAALDALS